MFMQKITTEQLIKDVINPLVQQGLMLYAVIDSINIPNISEYIEDCNKEALFINTRFKSVMDVSPYIIHIKDEEKTFLDNIMTHHLGIILLSTLSLDKIREMLSHYLDVNSEELGATYLRFYSPSVCLSLLEQQPEMFYGVHVVCPQITRLQWVYSNFYQYDIKEKIITITANTSQEMAFNRWGAWLSLSPSWQQKTADDVHCGGEVIEMLITKGLSNQMLLEKWRTFLADNLMVIETTEFQELLHQSLDEHTRYDAALQFIASHKHSASYTNIECYE